MATKSNAFRLALFCIVVAALLALHECKYVNVSFLSPSASYVLVDSAISLKGAESYIRPKCKNNARIVPAFILGNFVLYFFQ